MNTAVLEHIGLTRNESLVYLALLPLGTSKTGELLRQSRLNSGKIYEILESLKSKGLISESVINGIKHFTAAPPTQILEYLRMKKAELITDEQTITSAIPDFEKLRKITIKEIKAVTYTGLRGIQTAVDEALEDLHPGDEILAMGVTILKKEEYNSFWKRWSAKRIAKKVPAKHIFSERSSYYTEFSSSQMKYTQSRVLTAITPAAIDIFGQDKVLLFNYAEPSSCILIYDKNIATSFRQFFEQMWKIAKP